ncbi:AraC family transcriptional regulator [Vibrio sp. JPW-9-11-11]|uniref:AraC family transcriptional regulator n=1 Tax=Vibrio sp. JPW-9-11-11 TaxID=1416532 RepID=UPI001594362B|nr:AraC family transcriptional regulator [Vibrio sp. JPW-9-11-11]NVD08691.1 AraC family transcriptional regulator [Vibrio sp. JPW-9-11-11]
MATIAHYLPTNHRHQLGVMDVALMLEVAEQLEIDTEHLLNTLGLAEREWFSQHAQITYADKLMLFQAVNQAFDGYGLGLKCGERATLNHFGMLGFAVLSSANVEQALSIGLKYLGLNGPLFSVELSVEQGRASIVMDNVLDIGELLPFCSEFFLSALMALFAELTGSDLRDAHLTFPYVAPDYVDHYSQRFGDQLEFEQACLSLSFDASLLALPVKNQDTTQLQRYLHSCSAVCETLESPHWLPNQIKTMLYQSGGQCPNLTHIAQQYGCSESTLRRRLRAHNTSYHKLVDEARSDLAKEFLLATQLTVEEIGFRLGYSEAANFRRSFKRLTGLTPQQFRGQKRTS